MKKKKILKSAKIQCILIEWEDLCVVFQMWYDKILFLFPANVSGPHNDNIRHLPNLSKLAFWIWGESEWTQRIVCLKTQSWQHWMMWDTWSSLTTILWTRAILRNLGLVGTFLMMWAFKMVVLCFMEGRRASDESVSYKAA